jgi:SAM-dependent methyltransferase
VRPHARRALGATERERRDTALRTAVWCDATPERPPVHPTIHRHFAAVIRETRIRPARALEVGGYVDEKSLLRFPELEGVERYCVNLVELPSVHGITAVRGNANDLRDVFADATFDLVVCNATLEHDKFFWRSVAEMHRVLAPGGLLAIGVPGFVRDAERDRGAATATYRVHYSFDYYRFSEQAVREVFFDGLDDVSVDAVMHPPRLIGQGWKPGDRPVAARGARAATLLAPVRRRLARPHGG